MAYLALEKLASKTGVPLILTTHGYFHHEAAGDSISPRSPWGSILLWIERRSYFRAQKVIVVDSRLREYVVRMGAPADRVVIRFNSVNTAIIRPPDFREKASARGSLMVAEDARVILCARRLERKCGVEYAIRAVHDLVSQGEQVVLLIAGDGSLMSELRALTKQLGLEERVRFLGWVARNEVHRLLWASDVAVVPSITIGEEVEATSIAVLEAMASGLPVVASRLGGLAEIIQDEMTGFLVPERDPRALAKAIGQALQPDGKEIGNHARTDACERWSSEAGMDATLQVYNEVLGTRANQ